MATFVNAVVGAENAIQGIAADGRGVVGTSTGGIGVSGQSDTAEGVLGLSDTNYGVSAHSNSSAGLRASSDSGRGVEGWATAAEGVWGTSVTGVGVAGESAESEGVRGTANNAGHPGVVGLNTAGGIAVFGTSDQGAGVWGTSIDFEGVHAETRSMATAAMAAFQQNAASPSAAFYAKHAGNGTAGFFEGDVVVTGDITLANADFAEDFDIAGSELAEPGTVMSLDDEGGLCETVRPYDKRVVGVLSGAGAYRPGIILDKRNCAGRRLPVALVGKVFCKVDADLGAVEVGDLLTTSGTPGHAMRAADPFQAFGAVIGKALAPLPSGRGLIPILVALQ